MSWYWLLCGGFVCVLTHGSSFLMIPHLPNTQVCKRGSPKLYGMCFILEQANEKKHNKKTWEGSAPLWREFDI